MRTLPSILAVVTAAAVLAGCGDTLIDHRNVDVQTDAAACGKNLALCGGECTVQTVLQCGAACSPCPAPPENALATCDPVGAEGHDGQCGFTCSDGLLRCAAGCCSPALVAAGGAFACAATSVADGGEVHCWGAGAEGQLGDGVGVDRATSAKVPGLTGVTALSAGGAHACAASGATTRCWGNRAGFGGTGVAPVPEEVPALANASSLSAGGGHTCAVVGGAVTCTGAAAAGGGSPALVGTALEVSAGDAFSCALMDDAGTPSVQCWGDDTYGQLGTGVSGAPSEAPRVVAVDPVLAHVDAGSRHACASNDAATGGVVCWGDNRSHQLGRVTGDILGPTPNDRVNKLVLAVSAGTLGTCFIGSDAPSTFMQCWSGDGIVAGDPLKASGEEADITLGPPGVVSAGGSHTCYVQEVAPMPLLRCFGHDDHGQLGNDEALADNHVPVLVRDR